MGRRGTGFAYLLLICLGNNGVGFGKAEVVGNSGVGTLGAVGTPSTSCSNLITHTKHYYYHVLV